MLGYGLKIANIPRRLVITKRGCLLIRNVNPPTYPTRCSQNTPRKNSLKGSNISIKKYHQSPALGVRSGTSNCTPYVEDMNCQELPVMMYDM
jgi:hypothetical protein